MNINNQFVYDVKGALASKSQADIIVANTLQKLIDVLNLNGYISDEEVVYIYDHNSYNDQSLKETYEDLVKIENLCNELVGGQKQL